MRGLKKQTKNKPMILIGEHKMSKTKVSSSKPIFFKQQTENTLT